MDIGENTETNRKSKAVDLRHHLSDLAKARKPAPIKEVFKYYGKPGVLAMAGGIPHPQYFPFCTLESALLSPDAFTSIEENGTSTLDLSIKAGSNDAERAHDKLVVQKWPEHPGEEINLARALQYDMAKGLPNLQAFIYDYTARFFRPAYADFSVLVHTGNTDGWSRILMTLLNPGDGLLMEEWTYTAAISAAHPFGIRIVTIPLDSQGFRPDALEKVLSEWNEEERGFKRPRLLYTNPIGQNPCGIQVGLERKKQIYEIAVKYDLVICEDDPYYYLQEGEYAAPDARRSAPKQSQEDGVDGFIRELVPSYLSIDYQGRVIRLDTFSKTLGPGLRLGWFTCNPLFAERLERHGELSTQAPAGLSQALVTQLLVHQWGIDGYVRWLRGLRTQYTARRDALVDALFEEFEKEGITFDIVDGTGNFEGNKMFKADVPETSSASNPSGKDKGIQVSFVPPTSGMFLWVQVHFTSTANPIAVSGFDNHAATHEGKLWSRLADEGLLVLPGWMFRGGKEHQHSDDPNEVGYYRISFSDPTREDMKKAMNVFARMLKSYSSTMAHFE